MNALKLKSKVVESGLSVDQLCKKINMVPSTFYRKLNIDRFTIGDIKRISIALNFTHNDIMTIFFENVVA